MKCWKGINRIFDFRFSIVDLVLGMLGEMLDLVSEGLWRIIVFRDGLRGMVF